MPTRPGGGHARVVFDDALWEEDLAHSTTAGRDAATRARRLLERNGAPIEQLHPCQPEGRDGSRLPGCLKLYIPPPTGPWGIVLRLAKDQHGTLLAALAFGPRHPGTGKPRTSVYELADRRLHQP